MAKKRKRPERTRHLWLVTVRHRDYLATMNGEDRQLRMKETGLWIQSPQRPIERPNIDLALARARSFLSRHQRQYGLPGIKGIEYHGELDN